MKVVHCYDGHEKVFEGRGSVPGVVWNVARETVAAGHDVTVIERQWAGLDARANHVGVEFERLDLPTGPDEPWTRVPYEMVRSPLGLARLIADRTAFAVAALRQLRRQRFDILHVHLPFAANVMLTLDRGLRAKTVYTAHLGELRMDLLEGDHGSMDVPGILSAFSPDEYLATRAARTTVLNAGIWEAFVERGIDRDRLDVIPNGVDLARFTELDPDNVRQVGKRYGLTGGNGLLFVGTVMPRKGVDDLVRAVGTLVDEFDLDVQLVVAGEADLDPEYTASVQAIVDEYGLGDRVRFPGFVPAEDLPALYAAADVFVSPSREEGFGMTVVEAMAAGTPVVATRVGGVPRVVDDGTHGYLVEPEDPDGLASAIDALLSSDVDIEQMGEAARRRARALSWENVGARFVEVYESVRA